MSEYYAVQRSGDHLNHYGVKGMRWGVHRASRQKPVSNQSLFISGSSKTQDKTSPYYRRKLPKFVKKEIKRSMKNGDKILVGDAPGIDRQTQDYLKKKRYSNVEVFGPGTKVRYAADSKWKTHAINDKDHEPGSPEWLAKKDVAMTNKATRGLAVILDEGSKATRNNVHRMKDQKKRVRIYELHKSEKSLIRGGQHPADQEVIYYGEADPKRKRGSDRDPYNPDYVTVYQGSKHQRKNGRYQL